MQETDVYMWTCFSGIYGTDQLSVLASYLSSPFPEIRYACVHVSLIVVTNCVHVCVCLYIVVFTGIFVAQINENIYAVGHYI